MSAHQHGAAARLRDEPAPEKICSVEPREAWSLLQSLPDALLLDVRSTAEFRFVGHPVGALHVPWADGPELFLNPDFVAQARATIRRARPGIAPEAAAVVLICRSGQRSLEAADALIESGFANVYNVSTGFEGCLDEHGHRGTLNGWRFDGLPWKQS